MARVDAAAIPIERQWVTPADVVDAAMAHVRHALNGRSVKVDGDAETVVEIDPRLSSGALSHLLENAAQYSPPRGHRRGRPRRGRWAPCLGDRSRARPGSRRARTSLRALLSWTRRAAAAPGTGMGLAITRGLLAAAGGRVWAENVPGAGARFSMTVPRSRPGGRPGGASEDVTWAFGFWSSTTSRTSWRAWRRCCDRGATRC